MDTRELPQPLHLRMILFPDLMNVHAVSLSRFLKISCVPGSHGEFSFKVLDKLSSPIPYLKALEGLCYLLAEGILPARQPSNHGSPS